MECRMWEPIAWKSTEDKAYEKLTGDEKSTTPSEKSSTLSDKSTEGEEPSDEKSVVGMKRKMDQEEFDDSEEEEDYESDEEEESEEETDDVEAVNDDEPVADISIDGTYFTNEELLSFMSSQDDDRRYSNKFLNKVRRYLKSVCESHGFDITDWPGSIGGITTVIPRQEVVDKRNRYPEGYKYILFLADKAIKDYNQKNHTNFKVEFIDKVNSRCIMGDNYYITFTASCLNSNDKQTFQAVVLDNMIDGLIEVISCKLKLAYCGMT